MLLRTSAVLAFLICASSRIAGTDRKLAEIDVTFPPIGSRSAIFGRVFGLRGPPDQYKVCVYLESEAEDGSPVIHGPILLVSETDVHHAEPVEGSSSSPVNADGTFRFENWSPNPVYDPVAKHGYVFIIRNSYGDCNPSFGDRAIAPAMFAPSGAEVYVRIERPLPFRMCINAPAPGSTAAITGEITGLIEPAGTYEVQVYVKRGSTYFGPKPACGFRYPLTPDYGRRDRATLTLGGWATGDDAWADAILVSLSSSEFVPDGDTCIANGNLPARIEGTSMVRVEVPLGGSTCSDGAAPPVGQGGSFDISGFPMPGTLDPISGTLKGVAQPQSFVVALYLQGDDGAWWVKPQPGARTPIGADGTFTVAGWASAPRTDAQFRAMTLYAIPLNANVPTVLGGALVRPPGMVAETTLPRGFRPQGPPSTTPAPPTTPGVALRITTFPATGTLGQIAGDVIGLNNPNAYKALLYMQAADGLWWIKPNPQAHQYLDQLGKFVFQNWASYPPGDVYWRAFQIYIVAGDAGIPDVFGGNLPQNMPAATQGTYQQGYTPQQVVQPGCGAGELAITAFPAPGTINPVAGKVSGLCTPTDYRVVLYIQAPDTNYWIKPGPASSMPVAGDGTFVIAGWASYPAGDVNFISMQLFVIGAGVPVTTVLGAQIPQAVFSSAAAQRNVPRGYVAGTASTVNSTADDLGRSSPQPTGFEPYAIALIALACVAVLFAVGAAGFVFGRRR